MKHLHILTFATVTLAAAVLAGNARILQRREAAMAQRAHENGLRLIEAIDRYHSLYGERPTRLQDLDKVGYREDAGLRVCSFVPENGYIDFSIKHRGAGSAVIGRYKMGNSQLGNIRTSSHCPNIRRER